MGLLDKVLGNAQDVDLAEAQEIVEKLLIEGEEISHAYLVGIRDLLMFTKKRLIIVDKTGLSGKRMHIVSYPWRNVLSWSMSTAGTIDIDSELFIYAKGMATPHLVKFPKRTDTRPIIQAISQFVLD